MGIWRVGLELGVRRFLGPGNWEFDSLTILGTESWESNEKSFDLGIMGYGAGSWEFGDFWELGIRLPNNFGEWELVVERKIFRLHTPTLKCLYLLDRLPLSYQVPTLLRYNLIILSPEHHYEMSNAHPYCRTLVI